MIALPATLHGSLDPPLGPEIDRVMQECGRTARLALGDVHGVLDRVKVGLQDVEELLASKQAEIHRMEMGSDLDGGAALQQALDGLIKEVRHPLQELNRAYKVLDKFMDHYTVGFVGCTKAGKSTILEAFIDGGGSRIGEGGHRTTREVDECRWGRIRLLDTPGLDALGGEEDTRKALEAVDQCDLVLFVVSDDSTQEKQLEALSKLRLRAKAAHVLLNCKKNLNIPAYMKRTLADPSSLFDPKKLEESFQRIRSATTRHPCLEHVEITPICALAGHLSNLQAHLERRGDLIRLSRLTEIRDLVVRDLLTRGPVRRLQTIYDAFLDCLYRAEAKLGHHQTFLRHQGESVEHGLAAFSAGAEQLVQRHRRDIRKGVEAEATERASMISEVVEDCTRHGRLTDDALKRFRMEEFNEILGNKLPQRLAGEATDYVSKYAKALEEAARSSLGQGQGPVVKGEYESYGWNLKWASVALSLLTLVAGATSITVIAPIAVGGSLIAAALSFFFDDRKARARNESKARHALKKWLDERKSEMGNGLLNWYVLEVEGHLLRGTRDRIELAGTMMKDAADLHEAYLKWTLRPGRHETDCLRVERCLVALSPRLANSGFRVSDVKRSPGQSIRVCTSGASLSPDEVSTLEQVLGESAEARFQGSGSTPNGRMEGA